MVIRSHALENLQAIFTVQSTEAINSHKIDIQLWKYGLFTVEKVFAYSNRFDFLDTSRKRKRD